MNRNEAIVKLDLFLSHGIDACGGAIISFICATRHIKCNTNNNDRYFGSGNSHGYGQDYFDSNVSGSGYGYGSADGYGNNSNSLYCYGAGRSVGRGEGHYRIPTLSGRGDGACKGYGSSNGDGNSCNNENGLGSGEPQILEHQDERNPSFHRIYD